jgi:CMP-N-acetylneuraminic acid synthetase
VYQGKRVVALLPMKAHSERVTGKNFRMLSGKPLFRWVLDTLMSIEAVDLIVINTDARHILQEHGLTEGMRVHIRDRKDELCGDYTSMNLILRDDLEAEPADLYLMTHTTNPLLSATTISKALDTFTTTNDIDSLFTVNRYQTRFYRADLSPVNHNPENLVRTQDLEPWYEENSCLYIFTRESFLRTNARIGEMPMMYQVRRLESVDIDEEDDWVMAEALLRYGISPR